MLLILTIFHDIPASSVQITMNCGGAVMFFWFSRLQRFPNLTRFCCWVFVNELSAAWWSDMTKWHPNWHRTSGIWLIVQATIHFSITSSLTWCAQSWIVFRLLYLLLPEFAKKNSFFLWLCFCCFSKMQSLTDCGWVLLPSQRADVLLCFCCSRSM